jgi:hypothetical protein
VVAQTPELDRQRDYWRLQEEQRQEQQRRAQEGMQRQQKSSDDERKRQQQYEDERRSTSARPSSSYDARGAAELKALRARLLAMPPLPEERNALLGRWRVEGDGKAGRKDDVGQLMGMLASPGRAACQFTFGGGIVEFKPRSWASIDGTGDDSLGPIAYRADGKRLFALPAKGIEIMGFDVVSPNRVEVFNLADCALVRVAGTTSAAPGGPSNRAPLPSGAGAPMPAGREKPLTVQAAGAVIDGAAFRCTDGSLLHVSLCQGDANDAVCKLTGLHLSGLQMGKLVRRADIGSAGQPLRGRGHPLRPRRQAPLRAQGRWVVPEATRAIASSGLPQFQSLRSGPAGLYGQVTTIGVPSSCVVIIPRLPALASG